MGLRTLRTVGSVAGLVTAGLAFPSYADETPDPVIDSYLRLWIGYFYYPEDSEINDIGSRVGFTANTEMDDVGTVSGRVEFGFKSTHHARTNTITIANPDPEDAETLSGNASVNSDIFIRLGYVTLGTDYGDFTIGKNWSVYYDIGGWTDRFDVFGATAQGAYEGGDGGGIGTGRADSVIQYRKDLGKRVQLGLQYQPNSESTIEIIAPNTAAGVSYEYTYGASLRSSFGKGWDIGVSFNQGRYDFSDATGTPSTFGIDGNYDTTWLVGTQWVSDQFAIAVNYKQDDNHTFILDGTDYEAVDTEGAELWTDYRFDDYWGTQIGGNWLSASEADNKYIADQYYVSFQRYFKSTGDNRMFFMLNHDNGRDKAGNNDTDNSAVLGIFYHI